MMNRILENKRMKNVLAVAETMDVEELNKLLKDGWELLYIMEQNGKILYAVARYK